MMGAGVTLDDVTATVSFLIPLSHSLLMEGERAQGCERACVFLCARACAVAAVLFCRSVQKNCESLIM